MVAATAICIAIAALTGGAVYVDHIAPLRTTVLVVNDATVSMDYLLKRIMMQREQPLVVLRRLSFEEIVRQVAPRPPYGIQVTDADIDRHLRRMAAGGNGTIGDAEFAEWRRQQLNESRLSDAEFRELARARLLSIGIKRHLDARIPTIAEQVLLQAVVRDTVESAKAIKARLDSGEDFDQIARAENVDPALASRAGDLGWFPRPALADNLGTLAFDRLAIGEPSAPVRFGTDQVAVLRVVDRAAAREVDPDILAELKGDVLEDWFDAEFQRHDVSFHGFDNGYDSDTEAWIRQELAAMEQSKSRAAEPAP